METEKTQTIIDTPTTTGEITSIPTPIAEEPPTGDQFKQILAQIGVFLGDVPGNLNKFVSEYRRPLLTVTLIITALVTIKLTLAVLSALNSIPLLAPTFELIGIGYTAWFVYRYLIRESSREEFIKEFNSFKEQIIGKPQAPSK